MSTQASAHQRFIELVAAFYREACCELPYFHSDAHTPIAFEVRVDDVKFSVGYDPQAGDACLFVYCVFGKIPPLAEGLALRRLLELNVALAREHNATYCIDGSTQEVACYLRKSMAPADVAALRDEMVRVAQQAAQWRQDHFLTGLRSHAANADNDPPATPWAVFP